MANNYTQIHIQTVFVVQNRKSLIPVYDEKGNRDSRRLAVHRKGTGEYRLGDHSRLPAYDLKNGLIMVVIPDLINLQQLIM